jgi:hypothetical protein
MPTTRDMPTTREMFVTAQLPARPRRRGLHSAWSVVVIALVVVAIGVVGDRVAAKYAADELRAQLVAELSNRGVEYGSTEVAIGGFPFLYQVAKGRYDEITIDMTDVRLATSNGRVVTLPRLNVVATGVAADTADVMHGTAKVIADQVSGTAVVSFKTLETLVDYSRFSLSEVTFAESNGGVQITAKASVGGTEVPISATADVSVAAGGLAVRLRDARVVGLEAPEPVREYLSDLVENSLAARLPQLPFGLKLDRVLVVDVGLAISAVGSDVPLVT